MVRGRGREEVDLSAGVYIRHVIESSNSRTIANLVATYPIAFGTSLPPTNPHLLEGQGLGTPCPPFLLALDIPSAIVALKPRTAINLLFLAVIDFSHLITTASCGRYLILHRYVYRKVRPDRSYLPPPRLPRLCCHRYMRAWSTFIYYSLRSVIIPSSGY